MDLLQLTNDSRLIPYLSPPFCLAGHFRSLLFFTWHCFKTVRISLTFQVSQMYNSQFLLALDILSAKAGNCSLAMTFSDLKLLF